MLVIRLARQGRNKYPVYRIVAAESARAVTGKFVAVLGHYNPHTKELVIKKEETVKYLGNGAQPSNSVIKLLQRENVELPAWVKLKTKNSKPKHEPEVKEEAPAAAATEEPTSEEIAEDTAADAPAEAVVATVAEENAEAIEANVTESAPEDTAAGEEAKADAQEAASEAAAEAAETPEAAA